MKVPFGPVLPDYVRSKSKKCVGDNANKATLTEISMTSAPARAQTKLVSGEELKTALLTYDNYYIKALTVTKIDLKRKMLSVSLNRLR